MTDILRVRPEAVTAWETLSRALTGYRPPCALHPDRWQSSDPNDVQAAASGCRHCQVLDECDKYATAARESVGVWAGVNRDWRSPSTDAHPREDRTAS